MAQLDINFALDQFKRQNGRNPRDHELIRIRQAVITVPITASHEDYLNFWENEMATLPN